MNVKTVSFIVSVLDRALRASYSMIESRCMAQAGQLDCWASKVGHVIGPNLVSKPVLV